MSPLLRRLAAPLILSSLLSGMPSWAGADSDGLDETQRWVPSFGATWGLFAQGANASVVSGPLASSPQMVRPPAFGGETLFTPFAGGSLDLMTPRFWGELGRPRVFARVDFSGAFGFSYDVAKEGEPGQLIPPAQGPEAEVSGQGSVTEVEVDPFVLTSGAGVAFTFDAGRWHFRIKPSLEYVRQEVKVTGRVHRAVALSPTNFRLIQLDGQKSQALHGLGPGLEFELDAARVDAFVVTAFLGVQAYAMLGDREIRLADTQASPAGPESANWRVTMEEWLYRGHMGIRFRWLPQER